MLKKGSAALAFFVVMRSVTAKSRVVHVSIPLVSLRKLKIAATGIRGEVSWLCAGLGDLPFGFFVVWIVLIEKQGKRESTAEFIDQTAVCDDQISILKRRARSVHTCMQGTREPNEKR